MGNIEEVKAWVNEDLVDEKYNEGNMKDLINIQLQNGNWNYDPYMHGFANGMILMLGCLSNDDSVFLDAPSKWISEKENEEKDNRKEEDKVIEKLKNVLRILI